MSTLGFRLDWTEWMVVAIQTTKGTKKLANENSREKEKAAEPL